MFEDEKNDQINTNENAGGSNAENTEYTQGRRPAYGTTYSQNSTPYGQSTTGTAYGQSGMNSTPYGQSSTGSSYGQGSTGSSYSQGSTGSGYSQGSTYSSSYGQFRSPSATGSSYGQSTGGTAYGQGTTGTTYGQSNSSTPYGSYGSNYSYGQNSYSQNSYTQSSQPTYGNYQYGNGGANGGSNVPPAAGGKKKHTALKVVAAIVALALLVGGIGYGYNRFSNNLVAQKEEQTETAQIEDQASSTTTTTTQTQETEDKPAISTTTVSGQSLAVVTDVTAVVAEVMPAMVMIHNNYTASASYFGYITQEEATASGSGIIVGENDTELLIATNYHVIEGADTLEVIFTDDTTIEAVVKGTDSEMDLAVIAVMLDDIPAETRSVIKIATLGDSDSLTLGEPAIAIGNALGYGQSVTTGVVSAINREVEISEGVTQTFIQTDAAINPGNSGGALLNMQGEVIGINSNKIGGEEIEGMGYAIPISVAQPIIDKLMNEQTKIKVSAENRGYIGISGVSVTADVSAGYGIPQGVYVAEVSRGGGAEAAGISKGDVITEFDGMEITSMDDLQTRLQYYAAGTTVEIKVMRQTGVEYEETTFNVTLGSASTVQNNSGDSNAGQDGGASGQYDGTPQPALPGNNGSGKSGQGSGSGGH